MEQKEEEKKSDRVIFLILFYYYKNETCYKWIYYVFITLITIISKKITLVIQI